MSKIISDIRVFYYENKLVNKSISQGVLQNRFENNRQGYRAWSLTVQDWLLRYCP